ncbi:MAG: hypothetical protein M1358_16975 [Chloroflexi bacterium]|nr:hypothetical protein [Chloroflexota bacterium]
MPKGVLVYLSFHEPLRLRLPAAAVSHTGSLSDLENSIIDRQASEYFFQSWLEDVCRPYTRLLRQLMSHGARFLLNVSGPLLEFLPTSDSRAALSFISLLRQSRVTFVCSEAKHSLSCYLDIGNFTKQTKRSFDLAQGLGITPAVAVAPHMCLSCDIYYSLAGLPASFIIADGSQDVLAGRSSAFFRRNGWGPYVVTRNSELSLRIASMLNAPPDPMFDIPAGEIAEEVAKTDGEYVLLGWQVPSPSSQDTTRCGLTFLERLCDELFRRGIEFIDLRKWMNNGRLSSTNLMLPTTPVVSSEYGSLSFFLGHPAQRAVFGLMRQAYSVAQLTRKEEIVGQALDLAQWDLLSLIHRILISNGHRKEPCYLTPEQWRQLEGDNVVGEIHKAFENFIVSVSESQL